MDSTEWKSEDWIKTNATKSLAIGRQQIISKQVLISRFQIADESKKNLSRRSLAARHLHPGFQFSQGFLRMF